MKIDFKTLKVELDEELEDCDIEDIVDELPEFQPRYVFLSYAHDHGDGRHSFPLIFVYYCPSGVKPEQAMVAAGTKPEVTKLCGATKELETRDLEDFTEDWIKQKLAFFS